MVVGGVCLCVRVAPDEGKLHYQCGRLVYYEVESLPGESGLIRDTMQK